jgi:rod shape-determining protein MreD
MKHNRLIIFISLFVGFLLTATPIAEPLHDFYPVWIIPILFYWLIAAPNTIGLWTAWLSGLVLDILFNSLFAAHALALLIVVAFFGNMTKRFSFFSAVQQMLVILVFTLSYLIILTSIHLITHEPSLFSVWPACSTALIWPLVVTLLRRYARPNYCG